MNSEEPNTPDPLPIGSPSEPNDDHHASGPPEQTDSGRRSSGGAKAWVPPTPEHLSRLLPEYQIERILGRGGMGVVYKGLQTNLRRPVAIKLLPAELAEDEEFTARFQREAYTLASLQHVGIVDVYNSGQTGEGHLYFVMEFVDGIDLAHLIGKSGLAMEQAMHLIGQICDALHYAHLKGVIHRDIKPANVLLSKDGRAKLADFGLARPEDMTGMTMLTAANVVMGTPDYMAPEQMMGMADQRSDIYSLGIMFYQMLTGQVPKGHFPMPSAFGVGDERLDEVVSKAIQQFSEHRFQNMGEMKRAIDQWRLAPAPAIQPPSEQAPVPAPPPRSGRVFRPPSIARQPVPAQPPPRRMAPLISILVALAALGAAAWFYFKPKEPPISSEGAAASPPKSPGARPVPALPTVFAGDLAKATKEKPFINSLGMKFVPVPGTRVLFCIHETRRKDYGSFAAENSGIDGTWKALKEKGGDHPVEFVTWTESKSFCEWLSKREGRTYRLPMIREWLCAAGRIDAQGKSALPPGTKIESSGEFPWGNQWPPPAGAGNFGDTAKKESIPSQAFLEDYTDGFPSSAPVMSFKPDNLGLHDMAGNVTEWTNDVPPNGHPWMYGSSWISSDRASLRTGRCGYDPVADRHFQGRGFRCVLEIDGAGSPGTTGTASSPAVVSPSSSSPSASAALVKNGSGIPAAAVTSSTNKNLDPRQAAVAGLIELGARVNVRTNRNRTGFEITDLSGLPPQFVSYQITLDGPSLKRPLTDADLDLVAALPDTSIIILRDHRGLTSTGIKKFAALTGTSNIQFVGTPCDDTGAETLAGIASLLVVNFDHTGITDAGLKALAARKDYTVLRFTNCAISDASADALASFKGLKLLTLKGTSVSPEAVARLRSALPACKIEYP